MIVDTSAIVAIILDEEPAPRILRKLVSAPSCNISAATVVELNAVLAHRLRPEQRRRVDRLLAVLRLEVIAFDQQQADVASQAYLDFGKGSGHAAGLNLGDCYSYALASVLNESLLFVGDDFNHTDARIA